MKKPKSKSAWAILYKGQIGTYISRDRREVNVAACSGEQVVKVRITPVGKPYIPHPEPKRASTW